MLYSRPQLKLLLVLAATLCVGLAVREWRAGFPALADRLERFDRDAAVAAPSVTAQRHADGTPAADAAGVTAAPAPASAGTSRDRPSVAGRTELRHDADAAGHPPSAGGGPHGASPPGAPAGVRAAPLAVAPADARPLDINRAGVPELARLPGVGFGMAARIVAERERRGRFESPDALRAVLGMGPKKLAAIRELITVSD
jgi:competence ComEA-like helix-hairpin-helix protein